MNHHAPPRVDLQRALGFPLAADEETTRKLLRLVNLRFAALDLPTLDGVDDDGLLEATASLIAHRRETQRLLSDHRCPVDRRIEEFLARYLPEGTDPVRLPGSTLNIDRHGLARVLSLPVDRDEYHSEYVDSYRLVQGVLHNPRHDRRTTKGVFHVAEGGLPIPDDKKAVPIAVFEALLRRALVPPASLLEIPITDSQPRKAAGWVSLLLRPLLCPDVPGVLGRKSLEIRFFAPGKLVSNLDFVESIFGNAGDPWLPENDAGLDARHWSGQTGCVILAPHLSHFTKKELGLPHVSEATDRQRRDEMCWEREDEKYNNGDAFKITARDASGTIVTVIADNYFGYCKKEVKTQISYACNLHGLCEEEHAGGAHVYASFHLGQEFRGDYHVRQRGHTWDEMVALYGEIMDVKPEGYAVDRTHPDVIYVREDVHFDLHTQKVRWTFGDQERSLKLRPDRVYVRPSGYKVRMLKSPSGKHWQLIGSLAEGVLCHKPCTVSGGGKSEISKSIANAIFQGSVFVSDLQEDLSAVAEIVEGDYSDRFLDPERRGKDRRPILSSERSLGSVIKLLTPSEKEFRPEYNAWLESLEQHQKELVFIVKRFYKPEWGTSWREQFSVDTLDGRPGNELFFRNIKLSSSYLRVGFSQDKTWRTFSLRKDFHPAYKIQMEDDISASVVVPNRLLSNGVEEGTEHLSSKFVENCEYRLFQRPDDAVRRGFDRQTEADLARQGNFLSNFEPKRSADAREMEEDFAAFDDFTEPMQQLIRRAARVERPAFFVSSAHARLVNGVPTKNPRYLQDRPDLLDERELYVARIATRFVRRVPLDKPVLSPVTSVLAGRRNNPPDPQSGVRPLCVFNPIHYLELPELFLEYVSSMTGKSPSTTGAGSEGALTKGPFNALPAIVDLDNALVSYLLCGHAGFVTSAGHVGPRYRFDHDISMLVPEVWSRMSPRQRQPEHLIAEGHLERLEDFEHKGKLVEASRLGWRITQRFVKIYCGRVFHHPHVVFTEEMLQPELQDPDVFADGVANIVETHRRVAESYFSDGTIEWASPPLRALLTIMARGDWKGLGLSSPELRSLFTRESLLASDWYRDRLETQQSRDIALFRRHVANLEAFSRQEAYSAEIERLDVAGRLRDAKSELERVGSPEYLEWLHGTLGAHPLRAPRGS